MSQGTSFFGRWVSDPRYASAWVLALLVLALVFIYRGAPDTVTHTPVWNRRNSASTPWRWSR